MAVKFDQTSPLSRGFLGVDFFFVLSGFLITTLLLREKSTTGKISLIQFYWRRALRIFPAYFFLVFSMATLITAIKGKWAYLDILPAYIVFLSNFIIGHIPNLEPTWSLAVEEQYYLLWPLLLAVLPSRWLIPFLTVSIAVNVCVMWHDMSTGSITGWVTTNFYFKLPNPTYAPILMGSLLAVIMNAPLGFARLAPMLSAKTAAPFLFGVLFFCVSVLPADLRGWPNFIIHVVMTLCLAALILQQRGALSTFLQQRLIRHIGAISYGIYLFHLPAGHLVRASMRAMNLYSDTLYLFAYGALSCLIAELSFRTLESYFNRLRPLGVSIK